MSIGHNVLNVYCNSYNCCTRPDDADADAMDRHDAGLGAHHDDQPARGGAAAHAARGRLLKWSVYPERRRSLFIIIVPLLTWYLAPLLTPLVPLLT